MIRNFIRHTLLAALTVLLAAPVSHAAEIDLDAYPSYFRTRARVFNKATFQEPFTAAPRKDTIFFVDSTLRVSPRLTLGEGLSIVAQVDVADNIIWGGTTDQLLGGGSTLVNSSISSSDSFRGSVLVPVYNRVSYLDSAVAPGNPSHVGTNNDDGVPTLNSGAAVDRNNGWFNVRFLYADIDLPNNLGFVRVGRQPFDWGLGIVQNGGNDPSSDFGTMIDRLMFIKTAEISSGATVTGMLFADLWTGGTELRASGSAYDGVGGGVIYDKPVDEASGLGVTLGTYIYPWIRQKNFASSEYFLGAGGDLDRLTIYSFMLDLRRGKFRLAGEYNGAFGKISDLNGYRQCVGGSQCNRVVRFDRSDNVKIKHHIAWAARLELLPEKAFDVIGGEFGWVQGDKSGEYWTGDGSIDGGFLAFSPAYNVDHLLLRHVLPTIYQSANNSFFSNSEGGVQNTRYARFYFDFKLADWLTVKNQWLAAWTNETSSLFVDGESINPFIGNEIETTFSMRLRKGVYLDFTGSAVFAGQGLKDMFAGQAWNNLVRRSNDDIQLNLGAAPPVDDADTDPAREDIVSRDVTVQFVGADGTTPTAPGLTATLQDVSVIRNADGQAALNGTPTENAALHESAYNALRQEFASRYNPSDSRIWSFQTVLTVHLDSLSGDRI